MHWRGRTAFRVAPWQELPWIASSSGRAGRAKAGPNLWLVEVEEAGHMIPYDQPISSLKFVESWLDHLQMTDGSMRGDYTEFPLSSGRDSE
ncbi:hypothetical protein BKA56DRAFT_679296 [Ilyonectria sp. MPI-CAGE-AT-0026]|nr:hypothetical protein BKA56DRAFT_679296 [Ilyonectria sp. MPI-CAGE-AT-0026]